MRVTSSFWISAHIRKCFNAGAFALVEHKGAEEAGSIFIRVDLPDGTAKLFRPAPQALYESGFSERKWEAYKGGAPVNADEIKKIMAGEMRMDPDIWLVVVEDRDGRSFLSGDLLV